jgi:hypothetical protein
VCLGLFAISAFAAAPFNDNFANAEEFGEMQIHISRSNASATKEAGEPNHANNAGGKSVWFKWTAPMSRMMLFTTNRTSTNLDTLMAIYIGTSLNTLDLRAYSNNINGSANKRSSFVLAANQGTTYYIAVDGGNDGQTIAEGTFSLDIQPSFITQGADYDSDGTTDFALYRPSTGTWLIDGSTKSFTKQWGTNGDIPMVSSLENGTTGFTVYRPSNNVWYYQCQLLNLNFYAAWGAPNDIPVSESFGTTVDTSFTVFRPSNGTWYIDNDITNPLPTQKYYKFGLPGDIPVAGQYSPDLSADIAVFRPSNGTWYFIKRVSNNAALDTFGAVKFGLSGDKPVPADYDGDGILDVAVYRPSIGVWYVLRSSNGQTQAFKWGIAEDIPTTGDFDGDGVFDFAVYRPSTNVWYVYRTSDNSIQIKQFGQPGDIPVTANKTF